MPDRIVKLDGKTYHVPEDATLDEIQAYIEGTKPTPSHSAAPLRQNDRPDPVSFGEFGRRMRDLIPAAASGAAAIATGGMTLPIQALGQLGAGAVSGPIRSALAGDRSMTGMGTSAAADAATNVVPLGAGKVLEKAAQPLMRSALRLSAPIARKFGDIVPLALDERIMPTAGGAAKAEALRNATSDAKQALLVATPGRIDPNAIATRAAARIQPRLQNTFDAGLASTTSAPEVIGEFARKAPMTPARLDTAKSAWDDAIKNAIVARKFGGTTPTMESGALQALAGETRDALETAAPGYKAMNRRIMSLEGIRQAAANRQAIPATGLADHLLAFSGPTPEHIAARLAMSPVVKGGAAIGLNEIGKAMMRPGAAPTAEMIRAAILKLLQQEQ